MSFVKQKQTFCIKQDKIKPWETGCRLIMTTKHQSEHTYIRSPLKVQSQTNSRLENQQLNQTQRKVNWPVVSFSKNLNNSRDHHQDSPYFKDRVKTQSSGFHQQNNSQDIHENFKLAQKLTNEEELENKYSLSSKLFKLQLQYESLNRNYNLLKKQLDHYKAKAYQKTEIYMKLLQQSTSIQLNRFADIQLLKLKIKQIQTQNQAKIIKIIQTNKLKTDLDMQAIKIIKIDLQKKDLQIQNLQRIKYQIQQKLEKLENQKNEQNQSKNIKIQSLLCRIEQLQKQLKNKKIDNQHLFIQCSQLKEEKKQMQGQIHVLLAIQQKKSQDIQIANKKIFQLQGKINQLVYENQQLRALHQKINQQSRQIQFKSGQIEALKHREASLLQNQISSREKTEFIIQKKNKQIQEFTLQNERLYKDLNRIKLSTNQLCIKYSIKEDIFKL